jgi:hypothetical protein
VDTQRTTSGRAAVEAATPGLRQEAGRLLRAVYRLPGFDPADRYSLRQVQLWAKNERHTQDMLGDEDHEDQLWDEVERLLAAGEDRVFKRRARRFTRDHGQDPLGHLRRELRGLSWPAAKRLVWSLLPGDSSTGPVDDETAEGAFQTLQRVAREGAWAGTAAWADQRDKAWRLAAAHVHQDAHAAVDQTSLRRYEQTLLANHYFPHGVPETVTVYRGVPRPDATVRPGDYVTLDRDMARSFVRGRHGVIVTARLPAADLLVMRAEPGATELIYWPRGTPTPVPPDATSYLPAGDERPTLRQLWQEVNDVAKGQQMEARSSRRIRRVEPPSVKEVFHTGRDQDEVYAVVTRLLPLGGCFTREQAAGRELYLVACHGRLDPDLGAERYYFWATSDEAEVVRRELERLDRQQAAVGLGESSHSCAKAIVEAVGDWRPIELMTTQQDAKVVDAVCRELLPVSWNADTDHYRVWCPDATPVWTSPSTTRAGRWMWPVCFFATPELAAVIKERLLALDRQQAGKGLREGSTTRWRNRPRYISTQQRLAMVYGVLDKVTGGYKVAPGPGKRVCSVGFSHHDHYAVHDLLLTQDEAEALQTSLERLDRHQRLQQELGEAARQRRFVDLTGPIGSVHSINGVLKAHGLRCVAAHHAEELEPGWYTYGTYHRPGARWRVPPGVYEVRCHQGVDGGAWCYWFKTTPEEAEAIFRALEQHERLMTRDALRESCGQVSPAEVAVSRAVRGQT